MTQYEWNISKDKNHYFHVLIKQNEWPLIQTNQVFWQSIGNLNGQFNGQPLAISFYSLPTELLLIWENILLSVLSRWTTFTSAALVYIRDCLCEDTFLWMTAEKLDSSARVMEVGDIPAIHVLFGKEKIFLDKQRLLKIRIFLIIIKGV